MRGEQAIFNLEIKKKSGLSFIPDIHHSKVFSSVPLISNLVETNICFRTMLLLLSCFLSTDVAATNLQFPVSWW